VLLVGTLGSLRGVHADAMPGGNTDQLRGDLELTAASIFTDQSHIKLVWREYLRRWSVGALGIGGLPLSGSGRGHRPDQPTSAHAFAGKLIGDSTRSPVRMGSTHFEHHRLH
jgi:hypothetical protein